jgi:M6 family metalloprotease-like protein
MRGILAAFAALLLLPAAAQAAPALSGAHFQGLTQIVATSSEDLTGITPADVTVTAPAGAVTPTSVSANATTLTVNLPASAFARTTSTGTTIAARGSAPATVARPGEPAADAHILGSSQWTDNGWSTSLTDPSFFDPVTQQQGLYRFQDITPNSDAAGRPVVWNDGEVSTPAQRNLKMLVLFVQFPNRLATSSPAGWQTMQPYMDFLQPASAFWSTASYGQLNVSFDSPQLAGQLPWITMDKNANLYTWDAQTHNMFAYSREAFQKAYDQLGIKVDDYDEVLIMPARGTSGLANGPGNINRDPTDGDQTNTNQPAYVDHDGKTHYVSTVITAGNDMFSWGYRWIDHEFGHTIGLPDLYLYTTTVNGTRVNQFFYSGGWDIMGNIGGHANDYVGYEKYKEHWIRDDQVDVVSQPGTATYTISPIETPGGSKIVVIRTGLDTAYVAELRTKLGVDGLDNRAKYQGVLLYKIDASQWEQINTDSDLEVISKQYYNDPAVGGPLNKTGVWRPITNSLTGLDSQAALWGPGDVFTDPATGTEIDFGQITGYLASNPASSPYTADDTATITVKKTQPAALNQPVSLSGAKLTSPTTLHVDTSVELQHRITDSNSINNGHYVYVREESRLTPADVVLTRADGTAVPVASVAAVNPGSVDLTVAPGAFPTAASAAGLKLATKAYFSFAASAAVPVESHLLDVGGTVPATLSLALGAPASFGAFTPGVDKSYGASTTADVLSTAGDAALSVSDPGHLSNGAFSLPDALQVSFSKAGWTAPVSHDAVTIGFSQHIGADDALRTGSYARTLTFTLSTTAP